MAARMGVIKLLRLAVFVLTVQLGCSKNISRFNSPPFLTSHTLELTATISSEEEILEGEYDLHPPVHNRSWVLGFYFLASDSDTWMAGIIINHNEGQSSGGDLMVIRCRNWRYTIDKESWAALISQKTAPLTLRFQVSSTWVRIIASAAGHQRLQEQRKCYDTFSEFPRLKLAVSCHGLDCGLVRSKCEKVTIPYHVYHRLQMSATSEGEEEVMQAEFDFHPPAHSNNWLIDFDIHLVHYAPIVTGMKMRHNSHQNNGEDGLRLWLLNKENKYITNVSTNPWTHKTSEITTPLSLKFQVRSSGLRLYETTAGQKRLVGHINVSLPIFPDLWVGVKCWDDNDCGSLSSTCRNNSPVKDCQLDHDTTLMLVTRMMMIMFVLTTAVCVVLTWQCLHHLNTILHYLTLPSPTIHSERGHYGYDDHPEETDAPQPPNTTTSPKIIQQKPTRPLPPTPPIDASSASQIQLV